MKLPLAAASLLLLHGCSTYNVALLDNPDEKQDKVLVNRQIDKKQTSTEVVEPGHGVLMVGKYQFRYYAPSKVEEEFADALDGLNKIKASGLPELPHSYAALLKLPQGPLGTLTVDAAGAKHTLDKSGQAVYIDGYPGDPYAVDAKRIKDDFGPALDAMNEIIQRGFRPTTYVVLLQSPDGSVGKITVTDEKGSTVVEKADEAVDMDVFQAGEKQFKIEEKGVREDFGNAIDSRPQLPSVYVLLFKLGTTKLDDSSREQMEQMLEDIRTRPAPDVTIQGHTDTVGGDSVNDRLSQRRADVIAKLIHSASNSMAALDIEFFGKREQAVPTPDNTAELRNRRVEVVVR